MCAFFAPHFLHRIVFPLDSNFCTASSSKFAECCTNLQTYYVNLLYCLQMFLNCRKNLTAYTCFWKKNVDGIAENLKKSPEVSDCFSFSSEFSKYKFQNNANYIKNVCQIWQKQNEDKQASRIACIHFIKHWGFRDLSTHPQWHSVAVDNVSAFSNSAGGRPRGAGAFPVSYTHLTLPTILRV